MGQAQGLEFILQVSRSQQKECVIWVKSPDRNARSNLMQMNEGCGTYGVNFWFCMTTVSFTGIFALFTRRRKLIEQEGAEHSKHWQTNLTHNVFLPKCHTLTSLSVPSGCSFPLQLNFLEAEITSRRKTLKNTTKKCSLTISSSSICLNTLHNSPGYLK